ncbi:MAG: UDP-N-acetylenolpyruvoylglucosamine reductase [Desulfobacteraceae bacterium 4572_130]|nr:MAG: UDP-N-acetylenolpyruvoylglucosamine reductase [Desulfobacteraceae bacterium 4572_130]
MKTNYKKFNRQFYLKKNESMKNHTSFKIGGSADLFALPKSVDELTNLIITAEKYNIPVTIIGSGTNLLVKDKGIRGLIICVTKINTGITIKQIDSKNIFIEAFAGTLLASVCKFAMENGLKGFEFATGIPGTLGGAVMMNAGTNLGSISDVLLCMDIIEKNGKITKIKKNEIIFSEKAFSFNSCLDLKNIIPVILKASFVLKKGNKEHIRLKINKLLNKRNLTQPILALSAGCFFKNPVSGEKAGKLIEKAGLKGKRIGNAMVSEKHANFIVNLGNSTAKDILELKAYIQKKVFQLFSINLETEVKIKGE